ncbi:MAG TPA: patatin-like phospholipase family protein [Azospirillaceae bacterium]|nr:patatin-like phospholipase family protein [Azospirillaceae bacterium]
MHDLVPEMGAPGADRPRLGLALGGGVARGWAHVGVIHALRRHGIVPDIVAGCSIGALVGGVMLADHLDTLESWARALNKVRILSLLDFRLRNGGLIGGEKLAAELQRHLGDLLVQDLPVPFAAIATDLVTGHEVWFNRGNLVEAMRASYAMPGIFPPVRHEGRWLVDGALVNPVPVSACRAMGAHMVIAVNLNADIIGMSRQPPGGSAPDEAVPAGFGFDPLAFLKRTAPESPAAGDPLARRLLRREYEGPSMFGAMVSSLTIILDRITRSRLAGEPPDVHLTPRLGHIGLLEFDRAEEAIAEGEAAVERALPDLRDAMTLFGIPRLTAEAAGAPRPKG